MEDWALLWITGWPIVAVALFVITRIQKRHIRDLQGYRDYWYRSAQKWQDLVLEQLEDAE
jgi:hypothetical protein